MTSPATSPSALPEVLIFGEVLFDCFPEGRRVLGGAPFNVAWGLQGFGLRPRLLSAVGADAPGDEIRERMQERDVEIVVQRAREQFPEARPRVITDNGPQFIARDFKEFIRISGIRLKPSARIAPCE